MLLALAALAILVLAIGCTTRPEISETLAMDGNHSSGELNMVTADTSSDGFQYLSPDVSPNGQRVVFSADWASIPPIRNTSSEIPLIRQLAVARLSHKTDPYKSLRSSGADLVYMRAFNFGTGSGDALVDPHLMETKGDPVWLDDTHVLFWLSTPRGSRLFMVDVPDQIDPEYVHPVKIIYREPDDNLDVGWYTHEHLAPAVSPDGHWIAFSKSSYLDVDSLTTATGQSIWVVQAPPYGSTSKVAFPVTESAAICTSPSWSPDGSKIVFHATTDIIKEEASSYYSQELYTVDFDTTGLAATDTVVVNNEISRLTYSPLPSGAVMKIRNMNPVYSPDGGIIIFESDRRAPTWTLRDRSIWSIPSDGSLDPRILFFSREDDTTPTFTGNGREILFSSSMGFPTEMLDDIWTRTYASIAESDSTLTEVQVEALVDADRQELEFFHGVMHHLYVFTAP